MKGVFIISVLLCLLNLRVKGQDTIYFVGGKVIIGEIVQIDKQHVKYRTSKREHALNYEVNKNEILQICYSTKSKEFFLKEDLKSFIKPGGIATGLKNNPISFSSGIYMINYFPLDFKKLDEILLAKEDVTINKLVLASKRRKIASRILFYGAIPLGLFSLVSAASSKSEYAFPLVFGGATLALSAGIVLGVNSKSKRREAVDIYNRVYFDF